MASKAQKIRLGVFLIFSISLLIVSFVIIAGNKLMQKRDIYYITYSDVSVIGLQTGSSVKFYGINIGQVDDITIEKDDINKITVKISVKEGTPIKEDMVATLVSIGITGLKQIELTGGTNEADFFVPGDTITAGISYFDDITGKAEQIAEKFELLLNNLISITAYDNQLKVKNILYQAENLLEENRQPLLNTFTNIDSATLSLVELVNSTRSSLGKLDTIMANAIIFSENLASADIQSLSDDVSNTLNNINQTLAGADLARISEEAVAALNNFNNTITRVDLMVLRSRQDIISSLESLRQATEFLNQFSRQISDDPSILLRSTKR
ncbi:MAG TPA: MCE family protein [Candidatus Marinimicrobia bacterium]|nr:MCE family protein [Candidatus Neomarinimicrobiota bacterium]